MPTAPKISQILRFWYPLLATWLMMGLEGPIVAAWIARLPDPTLNLAAYGVAFAIALIIEAPVIMLMSAATALVRDAASYQRLGYYTLLLNMMVTGIALAFLWPPIFDAVARGWIELPAEVADRVYPAVLCLVPWPAAIGYRRFFQGVMIASGQTRRITAGTAVRLVTMALSCWLLPEFTALRGAAIGCGALSLGVIAEAAAVRYLARDAVRLAKAGPVQAKPLTLPHFLKFYYPLALTSLLSLAVQPLITFAVGRAAAPIASLAVLPVVNALTFFFRCFSLSYQEVVIVHLGADGAGRVLLRRIAVWSGCCIFAALALIALTPLSQVWFTQVVGVSPDLGSFGTLPLQIMILVPAVSMLSSYQTGRLIHGRRTWPVTVATLTEVAVISSVLLVLVGAGVVAGAVAATVALLMGRLASAGYLLWVGEGTHAAS